MNKDIPVVGFLGAGGIARSHAYSLNSLKFFYNDAPAVRLDTVCSLREETRSSFAVHYGFERSCDPGDFFKNDSINTVFILGPNNVHFDHLKASLSLPSVRRIYLEKPVCSNSLEEKAIRDLLERHPDVKIQVGFQYLHSSSIRSMLQLWKSGQLGKPVHFDLKYYHSDYLNREYRDRRRTRLTPAPDGGAMADLGSHQLSVLIAFLGSELRITSALQGGNFDDVPGESDLFSQISIYDDASGAVGTLSASRISSGTGDYFTIDFYCTNGAVRYTSQFPDSYEFFIEQQGNWTRQFTGSNFKPASTFPSAHVPSGWLRSMIHAHYVFLTGRAGNDFIPDINHGLQVQRLVTETAVYLDSFRKSTGKL